MAWRPGDRKSSSSMAIGPSSCTLRKVSLRPSLHFLLMDLVAQPTESTGKQENTLDGEELFHMISGESLSNLDSPLEILCVNGQDTRGRQGTLQHLGFIFANSGADRVIICSLICTDPEYLLFVTTV